MQAGLSELPEWVGRERVPPSLPVKVEAGQEEVLSLPMGTQYKLQGLTIVVKSTLQQGGIAVWVSQCPSYLPAVNGAESRVPIDLPGQYHHLLGYVRGTSEWNRCWGGRREHGLKLKPHKCHLFRESIEYLEHRYPWTPKSKQSKTGLTHAPLKS